MPERYFPNLPASSHILLTLPWTLLMRPARFKPVSSDKAIRGNAEFCATSITVDNGSVINRSKF